ncbi:MAG TPA: NAD(P)H-quinone oxidoreductase [Candidatus Binataceae bacterium]|nr:NAD(P)H-quinone oxidoreductase [Candidatus Binataceae bacterium]
MKAVITDKPGDESVLHLGEIADPVPNDDELLIRVRAAGLNRADIVQRQGHYPPPPGASNVIGLEVAGEVIATGREAGGWRVGERAMALLPGGGYAEKAVAHHGSAMRIPHALSFEQAAAMPEVFLTVFLNAFLLARVQRGDSVLIHGGGSGIGTAAISLLKEAGVRSIVTAGSDAKCEQCLKFGADVAINYRNGPFAAKVKEATGGRGVDMILDHIGGSYLAQNLDALAQGGRLVLIGLMGGARSEIDLGLLMRKHLSVHGSTLRTRPASEKAKIIEEFLARFGSALEAGRLHAPIFKVLPLREAGAAHRIMEASEHFGKIVLRVD